MAEIQYPSIFGSYLQGQNAGNQQRQLRETRADDATLRGLAPSIINGDPAAFSQAAAIDPKAAGQFQDAGDSQLRRLKGAISYIEQAEKTGNPQAVEAAYRQVRPYLSRTSPEGVEPPMTYAEARPKMLEAKAQIAMLDSQDNKEVPSQFRAVDMQLRAAGYEPGTPEYQQGMRIATGQEGRAATGGFSFEMIQGPDGRERPGRRNPRDGSVEIFSEQTNGWVPIGGAGQIIPSASGPSAGLPSVPGGNVQDLQSTFRTIGEQLGFPITSMQRDVMPGVGAGTRSQHPNGTAADYSVQGKTRPQIDQLIATLSADPRLEVIDETDGRTGTGPHVHVELRPGVQVASAGGGLGVSRRPEDEAAAVAQAKGNVELGMLPESERIKRESAIQQSVGIETGKMAAEKAAAAPATIATLQNSLDSIDALLADPDLGDIVGIGSLNPLNRVPGTKARGLIARADQIAGQSFLAAFNQLKGGGAITEREGQAATQAIARLDRSQSAEDYKQALTDLRTAIRPGLARAQQQASGGQPRPAASSATERRARNPQTGEVLVLRNGQWVPE